MNATSSTDPRRALPAVSLLIAWSAMAWTPDPANAQIKNYDRGCGNNSWNCGNNWDTNGVPGPANDVILDDVNISANPDDPFLDVAAAIDTLSMNDAAVLRVQSMDLDVSGDMTMNEQSRYQAMGANPSADLVVGSLTINDGPPTGGPHMILNGTMGATSGGNVLLDGSGYTGDPGSCTPPDLQVTGSAGFNVQGDFIIEIAAIIGFTSSQKMCLAGSYANGAKREFAGLSNLNSQRIRYATTCLDAPLPQGPAMHSFEVGGLDVGSVEEGFSNNFAVLEVEVESGNTVVFEDDFDNVDDGQQSCTEALYVQTLTLRSGSTVQINGCRVYYVNLVDEGGTIQEFGCGNLVQSTLLIPAVSGRWLVLLVVAAGLAITYRFRVPRASGANGDHHTPAEL